MQLHGTVRSLYVAIAVQHRGTFSRKLAKRQCQPQKEPVSERNLSAIGSQMAAKSKPWVM